MARPPATIRVDDAELRRQLARLEGVAGEKVLRGALRTAAAPIRKAAKEAAPVRTGELRDSIRTRISKDKAYGFIAAVTAGSRRGKGWYAHFVEFGVSPHFIKKAHRFGKRTRRRMHPGHAPKPFLRPAFDERKTQAVAIARTKLADAIARITGVRSA